MGEIKIEESEVVFNEIRGVTHLVFLTKHVHWFYTHHPKTFSVPPIFVGISYNVSSVSEVCGVHFNASFM